MVDVSKMKYPYGRCCNCGEKFTGELRNCYHIRHCPWCGVKIDDFLSAVDSSEAEERKHDLFCEDCGHRIYEGYGQENGRLIDKTAGKCIDCNRNLCGQCACWKNNKCEKCRENK